MQDRIIYFLRHGEAESNQGGYFGGQYDVPLTEKGRAQAAATAPLLADVKFDKIYCSDLSRAMVTAELAIPGCKPEYTAEIREMALGDVTLKTVGECIALWGEEFTENCAVGNFAPYGGENMEMLDARMAAFMDKILAKDEGSVIGVVSHNGAICAAARHLIGRHPLGRVDNCGVCVLVCRNDKWTLKKWNATAKL